MNHSSLQALLLVTSVFAASIPGAFAQGAHEAGRRGEAVPAELSPAQRAGRRFPQPVRVGDLRDRQVLEPSNRQGVLGRVDGVARTANGGLLLVIRYGGLLGVGTRPIAVPIEATALLGHFVQVTDVDPAALNALPTWTGAGATLLPPDEVVRVGLNRN